MTHHGIKLILTLDDNWGDCTFPGSIKDTNWYTSGYKNVQQGYKKSFPDYVTAIVTHFKNEPAIGVWEIMNEGKLVENPKAL